MLKKLAVLALFSSLLPLASQAQVVIRVGPPAPIVEHYGPPPRPGYVWQGGYHRWDGQRYVWTPGHYGRPPRAGAVWVPGSYDRWHGGYRYHRGYWR
ncbi:YXWGXW repeat-containing protein [Granulicella sp. S190]|uniref:YXWGXW repeat-containing protein n=1 Tax=Granulicella sp. S190 TaxID=1747226 RepID=UPI00131A7738|nr:YXWGXW repeat-containing protein [Granulicella sp. S190]